MFDISPVPDTSDQRTLVRPDHTLLNSFKSSDMLFDQVNENVSGSETFIFGFSEGNRVVIEIPIGCFLPAVSLLPVI